MSVALQQEQIRVTSIPLSTRDLVIFSGVPLAKDSFKQNSGKYYATVKIHPDALPVRPAIGQHWQVKGSRIIEDIETGDYVMQQHTYESPEHIECSLPESGEQLIQFIAKEKDFKGIGESKARALWSALGKDFYTILQRDIPENRNRLRELLSEDSIDYLFQGYSKYKNLAYCNWMSAQKIPASVQQRLLKHHGHDSIQAIKQNPYLLIGFGMAFEAIDKLVEFDQFEITKCDDKRLSAALEIAIRKEIEKGHTYSSHKDLKPHLTKLLKDKELVSQAFSAGHNKAQFILNHETGTYHPTVGEQ